MKSDINVTPLVDVVLVLLIIFMVVTPLMKRGQDVALPKAAKAEEEQKGTPLFLSVTADRRLFVESDPYLDEAAFMARLRAELGPRPERKVVLKADQTLSYGDVGRIMRQVREAGGSQVAFGVEVPQRP